MSGALLAALLDHPDLAHVQVLAAGGPGLAQLRVQQVVATTTISQVPPAEAALVLLLGSVDRLDWRIDALLRRLHAANASALMLDGVQPLTRSTTLLAERLQLPVLGTTHPFAVGTAARDLILADTGTVTAAMVSAVRAVSRAGPNVTDAITALSRILGRDVHLLYESGRPVEETQPLNDDEAASATQALRGQRTTVTLPLPTGRTCVGTPLELRGSPDTWVVVVLPGGLRSEESAVASALEVAAPAIGHRLALQRLNDERDARQRAGLLAELLDTEGKPAPHLRRRALDAGWPLEGWHIGIRIQPRARVDTVARRGEVIAALQAEDQSVTTVERAEGWVAWTTFRHEPSAEQVEGTSAAIRRAQRRLAGTLDCSVGVGSAQSGPAGIVRSLAEAQDAAQLAADRPSSGRFVHVDRLGLAQLLLAWTRTDTFMPAARALLEPLQEQSGDLLTTLNAYLDAESSLVETAAVLGVHRNTVSSRIARIQQLLAIDLTDAETRLALHLACRTFQS